VWSRHNGANQRWVIKYLDSDNYEEKTKGLNKEYGLHINRPFYIVSKLPMKRVVEVIGGRNLQLKDRQTNKKSQQFVFDITTKTIRCLGYEGKSIEI